jgi:NADH-quinone oxidoreductase subunit G
VLPRTPNGRGVAAAWRSSAGEPGRPPARGEIGTLIVSGDEAAYDPRVRDLAERARFVLTTAMFQGELTGWSHVVLPGTSSLERDGTFVNLEGRAQRLRRTVLPPGPDELEWLSLLAAGFGVALDPWAAPTAADRAELQPGDAEWTLAEPDVPTGKAAAPGLELLAYRSLFSGPAVERVPELGFQRPHAEVELSWDDAQTRGIATGDDVVVTSNGTSRTLRARVNRRLRAGVTRMALDHAEGFEDHVQVTKP